MPHCIARVFEPLLRLFWPAPGRHRRPDHQSAGLAVETPATCRPHASAVPVPHGEEMGLVRPYLVTHERRVAQSKRARRRTLWLAVQGVDSGPRLIHGAETGA